MDAIGGALKLLEGGLNDFLQHDQSNHEQVAVLSSITNHDGRPNDAIINKIVITPHNITRESAIISSPLRNASSGYSQATALAPLFINLHVAFLANFSDRNYLTGLEMISKTMIFFNQRHHFNAENSSTFPPMIEAINVEPISLSEAEVNCVMGTLGTKYLPSLFYKVRLLSVSPHWTVNQKDQANA